MSAGTSLTNLLPYSQQWNVASWFGTSNVLPTSNAVTAPDGSKTATQGVAQQSDSWLINDVSHPALYDGATVTGSVFLRVPSGSRSISICVGVDNASGRTYIGTQSVQLTTEWKRFSLSGTLPTGLTRLFLQVGGAGSFSSGQIVDVWGTQIEVASTAGPYVMTSALPVIAGRELTNILPSSQQLNGPGWQTQFASIGVNAATAPDGSNTAALFTADSTSVDSYIVNYVPNPSLYDQQTVTASVYLRVASGTLNSMLYLNNVGEAGWQIQQSVPITLTTTWQRFSVTGTNQNGLTLLYLQIGGAGTINSGNSIQIWGAQMVIGTDPAPYTPTNSSTTQYATGTPGTLVTNGLNEAYAYDSFGNILQNNSFHATYDANNRMFGYVYDAAGNLLSNGVSNVMTWDAENRIRTVGGATYIYDAEGNRVEKQGVGVTDTIYFGGRPIARLTAGQWTDLIYGPTGLLAEVPGTENGWIQVRSATGLILEVSLQKSTKLNSPFGRKSSAGAFQPSDFRVLALISMAISSRSCCEKRLRSCPFGRYSRSRPLVFSLMPRSHGLWG